MSREKIISIVGPTAIGKTALAIQKAQDLVREGKGRAGVEIISADSRQVYRQFEILSGADLGELRVAGLEWKRQPEKKGFSYQYLADAGEKIRFHGAAILDFPAEWSVALFVDFARQIIEQAIADRRQVIIVGGTGLYHDKLFEKNESLEVPPNQEIRDQAEQMSLKELQVWLEQIAPTTFRNLNDSDQKNPRRLIRKIEIALHQIEREEETLPAERFSWEGLDQQLIFPPYDQTTLKDKISRRVKFRFKNGAINEVQKVLTKFPHLAALALDAPLPPGLPLGFLEITAHLRRELDENECLNLWTLHEWQYAKRQITWWKNRKLP